MLRGSELETCRASSDLANGRKDAAEGGVGSTMHRQRRAGALRELPYRVEYSPDAEEHLRFLTARQRTTVLDAIDEQLTHQPAVETRNRKPMRPNSLAPWELRVGELRIYYDVEEVPERLVSVLAVGVKERNRVRIAGEVIEL